MRGLFLLAVVSGTAFGAGPFTLGVKAGVPLTDFFTAVNSPNFGFNSNTPRYIIGGTVELRLPAGLGIEIDALYRRLHYDANTTLADVFTNNRATGNAWEFPLLAKYRFPTPIVRPYVAAGIAWDTLTGLKQSVTNTLLPSHNTTTTTTTSPSNVANTTTTGFVVGFGLDVHAIFVHVSPEIRYTRWGAQHFSEVMGVVGSNQNQAEFLLGLTF